MVESIGCAIACSRDTAFGPCVSDSNDFVLIFDARLICSNRKSLTKSLSTHASEHYPNASVGVYPTDNDSTIALVLVSNKYRWRSIYTFDPSSSSLSGEIKVDVHYFEDGNVRMLTSKPVSISVSSSSASDIVRQIAAAEKKYQQDLNSAFTNLSEGAFKGLRRQLPVTRQKVEWEKISGYRVCLPFLASLWCVLTGIQLGQDIGGGRSR